LPDHRKPRTIELAGKAFDADRIRDLIQQHVLHRKLPGFRSARLVAALAMAYEPTP
jgi:hypothetical protein